MATKDDPITLALDAIRVPVGLVIADGDDPAEILALGTLVRRYADANTDLTQLRDALERSTLAEVVGDVAFSLDDNDHDGAGDDDGLGEDDLAELGAEEEALLGED